MLKLIGKLAKVEMQKTQGKIVFTFQNVSEDLMMDLMQYENDEGYLVFHTDKFRMEILEMLEAKGSFIDDLGNSPSKKMMVALKNEWVKKKSSKPWEQFYPEAIEHIIKKYIKHG